MPPMIVVAAVGAVVLLVILLLVVRSKGKSEPKEPRFEPPRELAPQKPKEAAAPAESTAPVPPPATSTAPASGQFPAPTPAPPEASIATPPVPVPAIVAPVVEPPKVEEPPPLPPIQETTAALAAPPVEPPPPEPATPVPAEAELEPEPKVDAKPAPAKPATPAKPRSPLRSYSSINDEPEVEAEAKPVEVKAPPPKPAPFTAPKVSEPKVPIATPAATPAAKISVGKVPTAKSPSGETDFSSLNESKPKLPVAEPKPAPVAEPKPAPVAEPKPAPVAEAKPTVTAASAIAAKYMQPSNPATAELEKNDPRHAAARRLARLSVSEIKLYHEDEVKTGREAKDLWTRLQTDIGLARQTFDARVVAEVRERFDYLLDEVIRQLAEGDASKLGAGAPELKTDAAGAAPAVTPAATPAEPAKAEAPAPPPTPKPVPEAPKSAPKAEPKPVAATPAATPAAADAPKPTGLAARALPSNPETAELEKSDPRHAAARRLARLSVSEIKLYHEAEVNAGREHKDLWSRLQQDIALATQTFEKRVDKEVRERFDYLYDEILRQLAEGDVAKLGPGAPAPKKAEAPAPAPAPATPAAGAAPAAAATAPATAPAPVTGAAAKYLQPSNPATAELEKSDPRHAAARRLARLSVSEIKLYHEDEVKAGREAKDLWTRMSTDIGLATQTFEKRVDKEVRDRFDYLYDEILRQLGEGDVTKLGPNAPKPNQ